MPIMVKMNLAQGQIVCTYKSVNNSTLQKIYEVKIEDFSRSEGESCISGYDDSDGLNYPQLTNYQHSNSYYLWVRKKV